MSDKLTVQKAKEFRESDQDELRLPCDVRVGHGVFEKGIPFSTMLKALDRLNARYKILAQEDAKRKFPNLAKELHEILNREK